MHKLNKAMLSCTDEPLGTLISQHIKDAIIINILKEKGKEINYGNYLQQFSTIYRKQVGKFLSNILDRSTEQHHELDILRIEICL